MNDQEAKRDEGKLELSLVPTEIIRNIAQIRMYGTMKYGSPDNWKNVEIQRYRDAAYRHWLDYIADPDGVDEESGYPHLWHCVCNLAFICELERPKMKPVEEPVHVTPDLVPDKEPELKSETQKPKSETKELKKPYQRIDRGKVKALRTAGWTIMAIADEMNCSTQSVRNILKGNE